MYLPILPVPSSLALSYDTDHTNPPDWAEIKARAMNDHLRLDLLAIVNIVEDLWKHPEKRDYTTKVRVRSADVLTIGGSTHQAFIDRRAVQIFEDLGIHVKAGFDGVLAAGTWDCQFAFWLTPKDLSDLIEDGDDHDLAGFEPEAIEAAVRDMTGNNDWAYSTFNQMRDDVIEDAKRRSAEIRANKEAAIA